MCPLRPSAGFAEGFADGALSRMVTSLLCGSCDVRWPAWAAVKRQKQIARPAALVCPTCDGDLKVDPRRPVEDGVAKHFLFEHFYVSKWPAIREAQFIAALERGIGDLAAA